MLIYLDNCCFNWPYDDQSHISIRLEAEAKLYIQEGILLGKYQLAWSYILDYENSQNPFLEWKATIATWKKHATLDIEANPDVIDLARSYQSIGLKAKDALHLGCAVHAQCRIFLTTDKGILRKADRIELISIQNPLNFVAED